MLYTKLTNYIYIIILPSSHRFVGRRRSIVSRILSCCRIAGAAKARRLALRATPVAKVRGALDVRRRDLVHVGTGRSDKVGHPGRRCITRGPFAFARRRRWSVLRGHFKVAVHASHERLVLVDELGYAIAARQDKTSAFNYSKTKSIFFTIYSFIYYYLFNYVDRDLIGVKELFWYEYLPLQKTGYNHNQYPQNKRTNIHQVSSIHMRIYTYISLHS